MAKPEMEEAAGAPYLDLVRRYRRIVEKEWPLMAVLVSDCYSIYLYGARRVADALVLSKAFVTSRAGWAKVNRGLTEGKTWLAILGHIPLGDQPNEILADQVCDLVEQAGCSYGRPPHGW